MEKINKVKAKKLFEQGYTLRAVPNKLNPTNKWKIYRDVKFLECNSIIHMNSILYCNDFNFVLEKFKDYFLNFENGYYLNYYVLNDDDDI